MRQKHCDFQHAPRRSYPQHEARHPWLTRLLNAYHISDTATRADLERETARRGAPPACGSGCSACCVGQVLPVSAFEVLGLFWFAAELLTEDARRIVRANLRAHRPELGDPACPFLAGGACAVYPVRPFICRQHHVYGRACKVGENLRQDRPTDIFNTAHDSARAMAAEYLPLFGVAEEDIDWRFESGYVAGRSKDLHSLPLWNIITHMDAAALRRMSPNA